MAHDHHVFISYKRDDEERVTQLAQELESRHVTVWTDRHIEPGRVWREEIEEALRYSAVAIFCIGDRGLDYWQRREVQAALDLQIHRKLQLIPVLLEGSSLDAMPEFLRFHHLVDCRHGINQTALDDLVDQIQRTFEERNLLANTPALETYDSVISQAYKVKRPTKRSTLALSQTRITFYLFVSALTGFILLSALTDQEVIVSLGTLNIAIFGMWIWALLRKALALTRSLTPSKGDSPEV